MATQQPPDAITLKKTNIFVLFCFREKVRENYKCGTYRFGYLDNISLVGTVSEEAGGYIPDVLDMLEENPFLRLVRFISNVLILTWS